ncbi:LAME_0C07162g1_1 [Lachancea meyersii CBS 8951]|uniref:LAME_0C07162g1_1 n=1 Tax=Lachancea meyersii CBS 8951 TaxID=1266667 RepID=A0A1G4J2Q8_9SACH|nr:LAME_0C07162g1_1 [Lachancea meyersii CBS 8951]
MSENPCQLAKHDVKPFCLLVLLYFLQGVPVGLTFGTVPFLLKSMTKNTTFTQLGVFTMATYPYSLKILWSPIVDSIYSRKTGRRRSWIIPVQLLSGTILWILGVAVSKDLIFAGVDESYQSGTVPQNTSPSSLNIPSLTVCFLSLIALCATQDIAVDGWALEILSKESLSYASTAQTVGLNTGYFLSFTIFLTFNSADFMNKYIRTVPLQHGIVSLSGFLKLAGLLYLVVTLYIALFTKEKPTKIPALPTKKSDEKIGDLIDYNYDTNPAHQSLANVYRSFFKVLKLPSVQSLMIIHFFSKFAFQCNEGATNLKLLERGFKREDLAVTVLIDFPFEIIFGYYVAKWSGDSSDQTRPGLSSNPVFSNRIIRFLVGKTGTLTPWLWGFLGRLTAAFLANVLIAKFPVDGEITRGYFCMVVFQHLLGSFMSTVQFVGICSFHTQIADPVIGGTYMTLLNTLSNLGGTWPRLLVLSMIDRFTKYGCVLTKKVENDIVTEASCSAAGGDWVTIRDGYFVTNLFCITVGCWLYFGFIKKKAQQLQKLPPSSWQCH